MSESTTSYDYERIAELERRLRRIETRLCILMDHFGVEGYTNRDRLRAQEASHE